MTTNLEALPTPQILEIPTLQDRRGAILSVFLELEPDYELLLVSDPAIKIVDVYAFVDYLLRVRIDAAVKATFLRYATGANLDNIASNTLIERLTDETDEAFRTRIQLRGATPPTGGSANNYKYFALSADADVYDAKVYSPNPGEVEVSIMGPLDVDDGVPTEELTDAVYAVVNSDDVRLLNDIVTVVPAVKITQNITATVKLLPDTVQTVFTDMEDALIAAHEAWVRLGKDLTPSWIIDQLHTDGVYNITLTTPSSPVVAGNDEFIALGTITLTEGDRDF